MVTLEDKCLWLEIAEQQTEHELEEYGDYKGVKGYIDMGCLSCNGYNQSCNIYCKGDNIR